MAKDLSMFHAEQTEWPKPVSFTSKGSTRGVTVNTSAFLTCHQCYCAGSSLAWGLNLRALVCGIF